MVVFCLNFDVHSTYRFQLCTVHQVKWLKLESANKETDGCHQSLYLLAMQCFSFNNPYILLRVLATFEVEIAKLCDFQTFWPVIQLMNMVYQLNYRLECPEVADFCYFCLKGSKYPQLKCVGQSHAAMPRPFGRLALCLGVFKTCEVQVGY